MGREARRLLIGPGRLSGTGSVGLEAAEAHYLGRVLRLRQGDRVELIDGQGHLWSAVLSSRERLELEQPRDQPLRTASPGRPSIGLALAIPKRDADLVWRMATELGADTLQPLLAGRGVVRDRLPMERWKLIIREAVEQCERLWLPELGAPARALEWLSEPPPGVGLLATTRRKALPSPWEVLAGRRVVRPRCQAVGNDGWDAPPADALPAQVTLGIGPEGGWTPEEEAAATAAGWRLVQLGEEVLRTSTAAVAGLAQLVAWRALSPPSSPWPCP